MRILYGVAGEGRGHSSRARAFIEHLQKQRHSVLVLAYGLAYKVLKKDFRVIKIDGIRFKFEKEKLSLSGTIKKSLPLIIKNIRTGKTRDRKIMKFRPEIAITDFEPVTAIFSYKYKIPLISIDNQHRLTFSKVNVPLEHKKDYLLAKLAVGTYIPKADYYIVLSFIPQRSRRKNVFFVSPILRKEVLGLKPKSKDYIAVYMNQPYKSLIDILRDINERFVVYGFNKKGEKGNLIFKKDPRKFLEDLASAKAVIASGGFTLMSESLYLKKPLFAIPLQGQFEQMLNALFLKQSGLGDFSENPSLSDIKRFLSNIKKYQKALNNYKIDSNEAVEVLDGILGRYFSSYRRTPARRTRVTFRARASSGRRQRVSSLVRRRRY